MFPNTMSVQIVAGDYTSVHDRLCIKGLLDALKIPRNLRLISKCTTPGKESRGWGNVLARGDPKSDGT
jgi:hypothetical protein